MAQKTDPSSSIATTLQSASQSWSTFSLENKKTQLQQSATQTKTNHQQSLKTRKTLADTTKAFKKTVKQTEAVLNKSNPSDKDKSSFDKFSTDVKSVVKMYQEEIDVLTKRCKASDNACLDLYKAMVDLPDPTPLFTNAVNHLQSFEGQIQHLLKGMEEMQNEVTKQQSQIQSLENELQQAKSSLDHTKNELNECTKKNQLLVEENKKLVSNVNSNTNTIAQNKEEKEELISLRREVAEYEVEFKTLKNQDITIKKLNAKIEELISNQEDELQRELKQAQEHLAQTEGRRATEALEREATMARKLASLELELKAERAGSQAAQTHLLEADQGQHEREAVWEAQRQILVDDADRLRELLDEATRERDSLKMRVEALRCESSTNGTDSSGIGSSNGGEDNGVDGENKNSSMVDIVAERKAYEAEVSELTMSVSAMRDEIRSKDDTMFKLQSSMQATIDSLENERGYLATKVSQLENEISNAPSKDIIDNMRRELRILKKLEYNAVDIDTEKEEPELTSPSKEGDGDDLETVLIGKLRKIESDLVKERREKSAHYDECQKLKEQLDELLKGKTEAESLVARLEADLEKAISVPPSTPTKKKLITEINLNTTSNPSTLQHILDPNSAPEPKATLQSNGLSNSAAEKMNDDHSVATIVMAQRDRLRARCEGLEAERDGFKRELQIQVSTAESLKSDNTKLYEKVRYLQNFNNSSTGLSRRSGSDRDLDLEALEQRYEASVDPFKQFSRNERQRKLKEMSPMEKTVFVVAKTVLGSKEMRTALFFYVSILHLLVFATTYHWSHGCSTVTHHSAIDSLHAGVPDMEGSQP